MPPLAALLLSLLLFQSLPAQAANVEAYVDRNTVREGEVIGLTIETDERTGEEPDFRPLEQNFKIIRGPSTSFSTTMINGRFSSSSKWQVEIVPKYTGSLLLPPIRLGSSQSQAIKITVTKVKTSQQRINADKPVFIHTQVDKKEAYLQEQIILTVSIYHRVEIEGKIHDPEFNSAISEPLSDKKQYFTNIDGIRFQVTEWKYALFPQQTGPLTVEPYIFDGTMVTGRSGFFLNRNVKRVYERSQPLTIQIKNIPTTYPDTASWLPAETVTINEAWSPSPPVFKVGEPITRTITIHASQQRGVNLPEQPSVSSKVFKIYPEQAQTSDVKNENSGIQAYRSESLAIVPIKAGEFKLPAITIHWWNTKEDKLDTVTLPEKLINVAAATQTSASQEPVRSVPAAGRIDLKNVDNGVSPGWKIVAILAIALWFGTLVFTLILWKKLATRPIANDRIVKQKPNRLPELSKHIKTACRKNDLQDAKYALLAWANAYFNRKILTLGNLKSATSNNDLIQAVTHMENILYRDYENTWDARSLLTAIENIKKKPKQTTPPQSELTDLYPSRA